MGSRAVQKTDELLALLHDAGIEFAVVGGVAAISHGAVTATRDLDIAAPMTVDNVRQLMATLDPFAPKHATRPDLGVVRDSPEALSRFRMLLLDTDLGRLDVLREVPPIGVFSDLATDRLELLPGKSFRVISLEQLIEIKAYVGRPKDRIVEMELRAIQRGRY